jgi:hypothetical protein
LSQTLRTAQPQMRVDDLNFSAVEIHASP